MELTLIQRAEAAEQATASDEFRIISEAALAVFGWQDARYKKVIRLLEAGASIDAAMMLVPEGAGAFGGAKWNVEEWATNGVHPPHVRAMAWVSGADRVYAATPALALCAAALRARAEASND